MTMTNDDNGQETIYAVGSDLESVAGACVHWRLSGDVKHEELVAAWAAAGLPEDWLPSPVSNLVALRRSCRDLATGARRMVRPLGKGVEGFGIVDEDADKRELTHSVRFTVEVNEGGTLVFEGGGATDEVMTAIDDGFHLHRAALATEDVTVWLTSRVIEKVDAVTLRPGGGFYFVPNASLALWAQIVGAVRAASEHRFFKIPAMRGPDTVDAIVDAVLREAEKEAGDMEAELASPDEALGKRAAKTRRGRIEEIKAKLGRYESLLGQTLGGIHQRLEQLDAGLATIALDDVAEALASMSEAV